MYGRGVQLLALSSALGAMVGCIHHQFQVRSLLLGRSWTRSLCKMETPSVRRPLFYPLVPWGPGLHAIARGEIGFAHLPADQHW